MKDYVLIVIAGLFDHQELPSTFWPLLW